MDEKDKLFEENEEIKPEQDYNSNQADQPPQPDDQQEVPWYQQSSQAQASQTYDEAAENENTVPQGEPPLKEDAYSPYSSSQYYAYQNQQPAQSSTQTKTKTKKKGHRILAGILAVIVVFCAGFGAYLIKESNNGVEKTSKGQGDAQLKISDSTSPSNTAKEGALTATEIYEKVSPSCVGIILYSSSNTLFSSGAGSSSGSSNIAGEGSGIIMGESSDGKRTYIITCAHVISSANSSGHKVVVQDYNGEQYDATIVGYDSKTDLGVLAIEKSGLTAAEFGDSSKLSIGETVYAIGNPGGTEFFGSYTKGMISAIDRPVSNEIGYDMKCIQHDAAINPGNSGGALINSSGQIIGINSSKIASTEYEGMGFAIPISSAKAIIDDLIANGYVTNRPKLGISYSSVANYQQYAMVVQIKGLPSGSLIIAKINNESSLKGTKAQVGDLITKVNGEDMNSSDVLLDKIENGKVGDKLTLTLCRISENYEISEFDITITLIEDTGAAEEEITTTSSFDWNQFFGY